MHTDILLFKSRRRASHSSFWKWYQVLLLFPVCCFSCQPTTCFYSYQPVDPHGWSVTDTLRFQLPADSTSVLRTFSLGVRYNNLMPYRKLWLVLEQRGDHIRRDTMCLQTALEDGRWDASGVICHETEEVCVAAYTASSRPTELLVYHIMSRQEIQGIMEVGVKVE